MNEYDIEGALVRYRLHPILGPASQTIHNLMVWTNSNSDGWPYWTKPTRAAGKLMELIERDVTSKFFVDDVRADVTEAEYVKALSPIKRFRTAHKADFEIIEL